MGGFGFVVSLCFLEVFMLVKFFFCLSCFFSFFIGNFLRCRKLGFGRG